MPAPVMLAELSAPCTVIISMLRTMVMVCTSGIVPVVVRSYRVLKELPFCSADTCNKHDSQGPSCEYVQDSAMLLISKLLVAQLRSLYTAPPCKGCLARADHSCSRLRGDCADTHQEVPGQAAILSELMLMI